MMGSHEGTKTRRGEEVGKRLKFIAPLRNERTDATSEHADYLGLENIQSWTGKLLPSATSGTSEGDDSAGGTANVFYSGDVLFGKLRPYLAKAFHADKDGVCSTELLVLEPQPDIHPRFLLYSMLSPDFVGQVDASTFGAKMPRANWEFIGSMKLPTPAYETQRLIADYLDHETARIDALVVEKEKMLTLLEEKRAALISRAVTRGLDESAPQKPSGLDWLGDIPAHWEIVPIKYVATVGNGSTPAVDNSDYWDDEGFPWMNSSVVNMEVVTAASRGVTDKALKECHLPIISPPAVLVGITGQGKTRGMASVLMRHATINQHLAYLVPERKPPFFTQRRLGGVIANENGFLSGVGF
ncbi:restriction endonuclease subunit S [Desulfobulbus alkaliphilus]|uniref:restriction endonuclease subunit S n=1 Tax=Desulfobulbus alkaliphilus TaxID=869814 RepID=UPI00196689D8|nr:restriction endonuclease subunit S [Desulfobulbus alkaliphilus]MBM9538670.1 restriction endonuclease subunit S [Desulfobulbus alkaliphilus]